MKLGHLHRYNTRLTHRQMRAQARRAQRAWGWLLLCGAALVAVIAAGCRDFMVRSTLATVALMLVLLGLGAAMGD